MQKNMADLSKEHEDGLKILQKKQEDLFNANEKVRDFTKWGNPDLLRMTTDDQLELLKDVRNKSLIDPEMQRQLWKMRQTHAFLARTLNEEMTINQQWAVYDMRANFGELTKFMQAALLEQFNLW